MKVRAKWNVAYQGRGYKAGDEFELDPKYYDQFKNDVDELDTIGKKEAKKFKKKLEKSTKKVVQKKQTK